MLFELCIRRRDQKFSQSRYMVVKQFRTSVGKSLRNCLLLLHPQVGEAEGHIVWKGTRIEWVPEAWGARRRNLRSQSVEVGPYQIHARINPILIFALSLLSSLAIGWGAIAYFKTSPAPMVRTKNLVEKTFTLPAQEAFRTRSASVRYQFENNHSDAIRLHYTAGNILVEGDLSLEVNGKKFGYVPISGPAFGVEERVSIPKDYLVSGINEVRFVQQSKESQLRGWGMKNVYVRPVHVEEIQGEDPKSLFEAAERLYFKRTTREGQLARAGLILKNSRSMYLAQTGSVPPEVEALEKRIEEADQALFSTAMAQSRAAAAMGKKIEAIAILKSAWAELSNPSDPRRLQIEKAVREL